MKTIKLVVFDIDGTLLPSGTEIISEDAKTAIAKLKQKGIQVMIATGRAFYLIPESIKKAVDADYYVSINGHCLLNKYGQILHRIDIAYDTVRTIRNLCEKHDVALAFIYKDALLALHKFNAFYDFYSMNRDLSEFILDYSNKPIPTDECPMGFFMVAEHDVIQTIANAVPEVTITYSIERGYDGFGQGIDKSTSINYACEHLNCTFDEVMVFGDGENDLGMLDKAGIAVVMGNAKEEIKKHADFVTEDCDKQGISVGLKHYNLI